MIIKIKQILFALFVLMIGLYLVPFTQLQGFNLMPGDIGDSRLNNYFLENIYQFLRGNSQSLWNLGFYAPFPLVLGFSDNLFGSSPVYLIFRLITGQGDTAFQVWFYIGYVVNFIAAYFAIRKLGISALGATFGALIFSFSLPTSHHVGHVQLHYRFGIPLSITYFILFLVEKKWSYFVISFFWLVWQFYSGVYMGFFALLLMLSALIYSLFHKNLKEYLLAFIASWKHQKRKDAQVLIIQIFILTSLLILLFYPYLKVTELYSAKRSWEEMLQFLPRPQSYFLSGNSWIWAPISSQLKLDSFFTYEHQMFFGGVPWILALIGIFYGLKNKSLKFIPITIATLVVPIILTLDIQEFSLWILLHNLPLFSAIRVLTRLDQALLFPLAVLSSYAIDHLIYQNTLKEKFLILCITSLLLFESTSTTMYTSVKQDWRNRMVNKESDFPKEYTKDSILFFSQNRGPLFGDEIDSMWVSLLHGVRTMNGYSGWTPNGVNNEFYNDCSELPKRVLAYLKFVHKENDQDLYLKLMRQVKPIGFEECNLDWFESLPTQLPTTKVTSAEDLMGIKYEFDELQTLNGIKIVNLSIINLGTKTIYSGNLQNQIKLSWRFLTPDGKHVSGWDTRKNLNFDIPSNGKIKIQIPIEQSKEVNNGTLEISLVKEGAFWLHDLGINPLEIPWKLEEGKN
jgi:hypothetical protein